MVMTSEPSKPMAQDNADMEIWFRAYRYALDHVSVREALIEADLAVEHLRTRQPSICRTGPSRELHELFPDTALA
jgi:hypothetical protein